MTDDISAVAHALVADAADAFVYPIPWWASMAILLALGVILHIGVHAMLQSVAARKAGETAAAMRDQYRNGMHPHVYPEPNALERLYRLPWQWLATSWILALWMATLGGGFIGIELLNSFFLGAFICGAGSLSSSWLGAPVREGVKAVMQRVTGKGE